MERGSKYLLLVFFIPLLMAHHPGYPAPIDFVPLDEAPGQDWVLVTTPGFVSAVDSTAFICKQAFGVSGPLNAAVLGPRHFAMQSDEGLAVTFDGCHLDRLHPLDGELVDIAAGSEGRLVAAMTSDDGDRIYWSHDGGDTLLGPVSVDASLSVTALDWLDETQVAVTAIEDEEFSNRGDGWLMTFDIADQTLSSTAFEEGLRYPYLFATGADQQVVSAVRSGWDILLVWGPSEEPDRHRVVLDVWPLRADVAEDGAIYVALFAIYADWIGVARVTENGVEFPAHLEDRDVRCVVADGGGLWLCSSGFAEGHELWRVDGEQQPQPFYGLAQLEGIRSDCPDDSEVAQICPHHWEHIKGDIPHRSATSDSEGSQGGPVDYATWPEWLDEYHHHDEDLTPPVEDEDGEPSSGRDDASSDAGCHTISGQSPPIALFIAIVVGLAIRWASHPAPNLRLCNGTRCTTMG